MVSVLQTVAFMLTWGVLFHRIAHWLLWYRKTAKPQSRKGNSTNLTQYGIMRVLILGAGTKDWLFLSIRDYDPRKQSHWIFHFRWAFMLRYKDPTEEEQRSHLTSPLTYLLPLTAQRDCRSQVRST
jgi:hypothetical protein